MVMQYVIAESARFVIASDQRERSNPEELLKRLIVILLKTKNCNLKLKLKIFNASRSGLLRQLRFLAMTEEGYNDG
jgi:hypothetical protein